MKKEATQDYSIEMFRKYAACGRHTYEQEKERIYRAALKKYSYCSGETAAVRAEEEVEKQSSYLTDIAAVEATLALLRAGGKDMIVKAVEEIYFSSPSRSLRRKEIAPRVRRFAATCPTDISNVYRWLKYARLLCATFRGLNITAREQNMYHIEQDIERFRAASKIP